MKSTSRRRIFAGVVSGILLFAPAFVLAQASQSALRFYGTGVGPPLQQDRVRIQIDDNVPGPDASAACDVGAGSFTLEWWMRGNLADNNTANDGGDVETFGIGWINGNIIVDRDIFGGSERKWGISIAGGFIRFGTSEGDPPNTDAVPSTIEGNTNVLDGQWHHVACVRDVATGQKHIYVDGVLDYSGMPGISTVDISYPDDGENGQITEWGWYIVLAAEKHDAGAAFPSYNGYMDELRIWNTARTQAELQATYNQVIPSNTPGLVAYYRFEEGAGNSIMDSSAAGSPTGHLIDGTPGNGEWVSAGVDPNNVAPVSGTSPAGFTRSVYVGGGLNEPTVIEFTPDRRLLIGQRDGAIRMVENDVLLAAPVIQIPANTTNGERGLVGLTLDPDFANNGFLYVYYTTNEPRNRVGRFTLIGNTAAPASEVVIWENPALAADFHHGGAIFFGNDGNLYIATGDQFITQDAQDLSSQHGKLLRVAADGSIPPDNPFVDVAGAEEEIWALGLRNPFRCVNDRATGTIYIGNVGGNSFDSWEEVNVGASGANYGWPNQEGPECFIPDCSAYTFPIYDYQHNDPVYFTTQNQGSLTLGPVYRGTTFPATYLGSLFAADYANRWIRRLTFDGGGNVAADYLFLAPPDSGTIVDLDVGPDGALYFVTIGIPWSGAPDSPAIHRVAYTGGNQVPVVVIGADVTQGVEPLSVQFDSTGTFDPDAGPSPLTFDWQFGDGGSSTQPNPQYDYTTRGTFNATLTVDDGQDQSTSSPIAITVGNPPVATLTQPAPGTTYRAGDTIPFAGTAVDLEDGPLSASAFSWRVVLRHAAHVHPFLGPLDGVTQGSFVIPSTGHAPEDTFYEIELTVTDADGIQDVETIDVLPVIATINFDTVPSGIPVFLDGEAINTPRNYDSLPGFQHVVEAQASFVLGQTAYEFECWSDGGDQLHTYVTPEGGGSLTAYYTPFAGQTTIVEPVLANDRDGDSWPGAGGEGLTSNFHADAICSGRDDVGIYQAGLQFQVAIPQGAQIISATIDLVANSDQFNNPVAEIRAFDVGNAEPFDASHTHAMTDHHPMTSQSVTWNYPAFTNGQTYTSPDLATVVQAVIDRPDWVANNYLGLVLDGAPSGAPSWRCFYNFLATPPLDVPTLTVEYAIPGGGDADIDGDGDTDMTDVQIFVEVLLMLETQCDRVRRADLDADGQADGDDISPFTQAFLM